MATIHRRLAQVPDRSSGNLLRKIWLRI